jgi:methylthioxylose transferase
MTVQPGVARSSAPTWGLGRASRAIVVGALWAGALWLIWLSVQRGRELQRTDPEVFLGAAPLIGRNFRDGWDWRFGWSLLGAGAIGLGLSVACWRGWWSSMRLRWTMVTAAAGSMVFAVLLALTDGRDGLAYGAEHETEYLANLPRLPAAGEFVRTFVERLPDYSVHVRGHPPGFVLLLQWLDLVGAGGVWSTVSLSVLATGALVIGVLLTVHALAGARWARQAAPFLVVSPYLIWMITSADAVYTAVGALGVASIAVGMRRRGPAALVFGLAGGIALGGLLFGTYLGAVLLIVPVAVLVSGWRRRAPGVAMIAVGGVVGAAAVTTAFALAGFWWFDGVGATRAEYLAGSAQFRPWWYFSYANLAAAAIALGPAVVVGIARLRDRHMWVLVGAGAAALLASHLTRYTKAEVERIWLLFYPWLAVAAGSLFVARPGEDDVGRQRRAALWVGAQASGAIVLQAALVTKW